MAEKLSPFMLYPSTQFPQLAESVHMLLLCTHLLMLVIVMPPSQDHKIIYWTHKLFRLKIIIYAYHDKRVNIPLVPNDNCKRIKQRREPIEFCHLNILIIWISRMTEVLDYLINSIYLTSEDLSWEKSCFFQNLTRNTKFLLL